MFEGYLIKLNGNEIPASIMVPGSYESSKNRVVAGSWRDANGDMHYSYYPHEKVEISFTIKPRTMEQQSTIVHFFRNKDNILVRYWDETEEEYREVVCRMDDVTFKHSYDAEDRMFYADTAVSLEEY